MKYGCKWRYKKICGDNVKALVGNMSFRMVLVCSSGDFLNMNMRLHQL